MTDRADGSERVLDALTAGRRNETDGLTGLVRLAMSDPRALELLVKCSAASEARVASRATWVLRRIAEADAQPLAKHAAFLLKHSAGSSHWEVRAELCHVLPRLDLTRPQRARAAELFIAGLADPSRIVQAWSLDALHQVAQLDERLAPRARDALLGALESPFPSVRARARNLMKQSERASKSASRSLRSRDASR